MAVGLFGLIRHIQWQGEGLIGRLLSDNARKGYAIYLAHIIILCELAKVIMGKTGNVAVEIPLIAILSFLLTHLTIALLSLLPKARHWLGC